MSNKHSLEKHPDKAINFTPKDTKDMVLKIVAEQNFNILEEIEGVKKDLKGAFIELLNMFETSINKLKDDNNEKCVTLANTVI